MQLNLMKIFTLNIGEVATHVGEARYQCFGIGSCIGLFLSDRMLNVTGAAHILLPGAERGPDDRGWYSVELAINELIRRFERLGSNLTGLTAKVVGGASTLSNTRTGGRNIESVMEHLRRRNIYIACADVGGTKSRTVCYDAPLGSLSISMQGVFKKTIL